MITPRRFGKPLVLGRTGPYVPPPPPVLPDQRAQLQARAGRPPAQAQRAQGPGIINRDAVVRVYSWDEYSKRRAAWDDATDQLHPGSLEPGDAAFGTCHGIDPKDLRVLWLALPTANGKVSEGCLYIVPPGGKPPAKQRPRWDWNGSETKPTLSPSIRHADASSPWYWHGFLRDGVLHGCVGEHAPA